MKTRGRALLVGVATALGGASGCFETKIVYVEDDAEAEPGGAPSFGGSPASGGLGGAAEPIAWLTVDADRAPDDVAPNDALRIAGAFYAYGDDCAKLDWDPVTRCATGVLCTAGPTFENWGVAIGFDFRNTGEDGDPPNAKMPWDPRLVNARGLAWAIRGRAPALQVWVLNMDPRWGGLCSAKTCEIVGPPDGIEAAPLNGQLWFDAMVKDNWASGVTYVFDPAAVHALQFKLPAIIAGSQSFSFCVERLGILL